MDCEKCESLQKEVDLLQTLLRVEEKTIEQLRNVLDRLRKLDEFKL